jgi:hypothetical protein
MEKTRAAQMMNVGCVRRWHCQNGLDERSLTMFALAVFVTYLETSFPYTLRQIVPTLQETQPHQVAFTNLYYLLEHRMLC